MATQGNVPLPPYRVLHGAGPIITTLGMFPGAVPGETPQAAAQDASEWRTTRRLGLGRSLEPRAGRGSGGHHVARADGDTSRAGGTPRAHEAPAPAHRALRAPTPELREDRQQATRRGTVPAAAFAAAATAAAAGPRFSVELTISVPTARHDATGAAAASVTATSTATTSAHGAPTRSTAAVPIHRVVLDRQGPELVREGSRRRSHRPGGRHGPRVHRRRPGDEPPP